MKSIRGYAFLSGLLIFVMSCAGLGAKSTPAPESESTAAPANGSPGGGDTPNAPANTGTTFPAESVSTFDFQNAPGGRFEPFRFTIDPEGNFYLINQSSGNTPPQFLKFDANGQLLAQMGTYGEGQGQFNAPNGLAVDSQGSVYLSDAYHIVPIQKYDPTGNFLAGWAKRGGGDGEFTLASSIAVDGEGNLFVVDADARPSHRIQKFDNQGNFVTLWDAHADQGENASSFDITVDPQGDVYLYIPRKNFRIIKFDPNGQVLAEWDQPTCGSTPIENPSIAGIWVDAQGQVYITDINGSRICVLDQNGTFVGAWGGPGQLSGPLDIVGDDAGNIYVLESGRVQTFHINK